MFISSLCDLFIYQLKDGQKKNGDRNIYLDFSKGINLTDHTAISVFFADLVSVRYRKDIYQNWLSLLGKEHVQFAVVLLPLCCLVNEGHIIMSYFVHFFSRCFYLASFGGILGLLLGFSFVTVFELIYFFTIRVFFDRLKANTNTVPDSGS